MPRSAPFLAPNDARTRSSLATLLLGTLALAALPSAALAQAGLRVSRIDGSGVRVDGSLREWRDVHRSPVGTGSDASAQVSIAYDDTGLWIAAEVQDDRVVRTSDHGDDEDALVVTLAFPSGRRMRGTELWLFSGVDGSAAAITSGAPGARRRSAVTGALVVEAPATGGYTIEAFVPWARIDGGDRLEEGRGAVRLRDVDVSAHPEVEAEPALGTVDASHLDTSMLPLLVEGGERASMQAFLAAQHLDAATLPRHDFHEDVAGDARVERVSIVGRFVVVMGRGWHDGQYSFVGLDITDDADLVHAEMRDVTGDGKDELLVTLRQRGTGGSRDVWEVIRFAGDTPAAAWSVEVRQERPAGTLACEVEVRRGRRSEPPSVVLGDCEADGLDALTFREAPASDAEAILLPWGPVRERTFRWDGTRFARVEEEANPDYVDPAAAAAASAASAASAGGSGGAAASTPAAPTVDELLAAFRTQNHIRSSVRATHDLTGNVSGDTTTERVVVYGRHLVVVGTAFRGGTGWFDYAIPAATDADLVSVTLADVTGEGRAELFFRIRQTIGDVRREVIMVHHFTPTGFPVLLTREVAREQGSNRIANEVVTTGGRLVIRPGAATGWDASTWPWGDETGSDGVEPPLLPWRDSDRTFRYSSERLVSP